MQPDQVDFQDEFLQTIKQALSPDFKILYLCLIGSQAKNISSKDPDYEVRAIIAHPVKNYLLQQADSSTPITTFFKGKKVEGTAVDILKIYDYALDTNFFLIEVLRGIPIYKASEKLIEDIKTILLEAYLPIGPLYSFQGLLYSYVKPQKKAKDKYTEKITAEIAAECVYVVLELRCLHQGKNILDYATIDQLMEFAGEDEELIRSIIEIRRKNKEEEVLVTNELAELVQGAIDATVTHIQAFEKKEKERIMQKREELRNRVDRLCLDIISP